MITPRSSVDHESCCVDDWQSWYAGNPARTAIAMIQSCYRSRDNTCPDDSPDDRLWAWTTDAVKLMRSTAQQLETTLMTCVDTDRPPSIQTSRSRITDEGWTDLAPKRKPAVDSNADESYTVYMYTTSGTLVFSTFSCSCVFVVTRRYVYFYFRYLIKVCDSLLQEVIVVR